MLFGDHPPSLCFLDSTWDLGYGQDRFFLGRWDGFVLFVGQRRLSREGVCLSGCVKNFSGACKPHALLQTFQNVRVWIEARLFRHGFQTQSDSVEKRQGMRIFFEESSIA